jgi:hypothetical protein
VDSNNNKERSQQVGMNNRTTGEEIDFSREEFVIYITTTKILQKKKKKSTFLYFKCSYTVIFVSYTYNCSEKQKRHFIKEQEKDTSSKMEKDSGEESAIYLGRTEPFKKTKNFSLFQMDLVSSKIELRG